MDSNKQGSRVNSNGHSDDTPPGVELKRRRTIPPVQGNGRVNVEPPARATPCVVGPANSSPDPFDLKNLRLSQDFESSLGVKKVLLTVPVRKPANESFIQVHPSEEYRVNACVVELKTEGEIYWVAPGLWSQLATEPTFSPRALFSAITRQNDVFLWPVRLPGSDGRIDTYNKSALEAAHRAVGKWVRVAANLGLKTYDVWEATAPIQPPKWPDMPFQELLRIAFGGKLIDTPDHLVLRKLRGEA